jgi:hypothetical protein
MTTNDFLREYEKKQPLIAQRVCDGFIKSMKEFNPNRTDMMRSDWLSVMLNDYDVQIHNDEIELIPKGQIVGTSNDFLVLDLSGLEGETWVY